MAQISTITTGVNWKKGADIGFSYGATANHSIRWNIIPSKRASTSLKFLHHSVVARRILDFPNLVNQQIIDQTVIKQ